MEEKRGESCPGLYSGELEEETPAGKPEKTMGVRRKTGREDDVQVGGSSCIKCC